MVQCWIMVAHLMRLCRFWFETCVYVLPLGWICYLHVYSRHCFWWQLRANKRAPVKGQLESSWNVLTLNNIFRRLPSRTDFFFGRQCRRHFLILPDSLYLAQIFCTLFSCSWTALQLHDFKFLTRFLLPMSRLKPITAIHRHNNIISHDNV